MTVKKRKALGQSKAKNDSSTTTALPDQQNHHHHHQNNNKNKNRNKSSGDINGDNDDDVKTSNGKTHSITTKEKKEKGDEDKEGEEKQDDKYNKESHSTHNHNNVKSKKLKKIRESRRVMFILGALLGLVITVFFTTSKGTFPADLDNLVNFDQLNNMFEDWTNWKEILPNGLQSFLQDADAETKLHGSADSFSVGQRLKALQNYTAKYNVVMVPGVISTGLESWGTTTTGDCPSIGYFRKRLWGSFFMLRTMVLDKACWLKNIMLDEETGLDPPDIKVRAAQGFEAADFFLAGYWIWNKILQNLAVIGYSPDNMISAAYDWRLTYIDLEKRDGYFSKLKSQIEMTKKMTGQKSVLVGHSMGSQVIFFFLKWVEAKGEHFGNGGSKWVNTYIEAVIDISGSMLGTPKTIPALLSGEMKDTVQLNALAVYGLEQFFSRRERVDMLRTFGGVASMFPKGGDVIWGNLTYAPDDPVNTLETNITDGASGAITEGASKSGSSFGSFMKYKQEDGTVEEFTIAQSLQKLLKDAPGWYSKRVEENYSHGVAKTASQLSANNQDPLKWVNPLEASLPNAPNLKLYCFYGVGNPTERAYKYVPADKKSVKLDAVIDSESADGVALGDGDGTVSLLTHVMCHEWQKGSKSRYNPGNVDVTVVEIKHEPDRFDLRGGAKTAEHVDILGSAELNELVLTVASGHGDKIKNRYVSNLKQIVENMDL
ncbi:Phospholipid:diacylglycerol acyltransferase [Lodderomyces elongisporus NRRL YB-4239]|uniref:Phospholipid:diacylglycerol acyltransferase n=1 Tax=Lodderomyces elongisporus (strain ATCC 11503 / CBS 2605 / JCM 1781 / NBRC 1676 / NRRL YB-4239) TaxID=379508 RepID=A5DVJ2_LODEL|nr:Phospholipid:diacylglycerol acyltransferase [Lodderomyces elongisporus NRRL YB-4239]